MAHHTLIVTRSGKDQSGNITSICGANWHHDSATAIANIRAGTHEYRVLRQNGPYVRPYGDKFLRSDPDSVTGNNLESLPNC